MNLSRFASRVAIGGTATALAVAGLVGATTTSASAATFTTSYTCTGLSNPVVVTTTPKLALPPTAPAGYPVPAGFLGFDSTLTVSAADQGALSFLGVTRGKSTDFATQFGTVAIPTPVAWTVKSQPTNADPATYSGGGANGAVQLPAAGTYTIAMPGKFTLIGTDDAGNVKGQIPCTTTAPATISTIALSKQASVTKVKAAKKVKSGAVESVKIKVTNDYSKDGGVVPTGKVTIKDGKKTLGKGKLKNGKVTIKVKKLSVGTHKLVVKYGGDSYTAKSKSKTLKVTVVK